MYIDTIYMRVVAPVGILDHTQKLFCQLAETVLLLRRWLRRQLRRIHKPQTLSEAWQARRVESRDFPSNPGRKNRNSINVKGMGFKNKVHTVSWPPPGADAAATATAAPCAARAAAAAYKFFGRCQRLGLCYKLRMSLLLLRRHRHRQRVTQREWRLVAPPPHVAIHDADQEQQQQQQLVTHTTPATVWIVSSLHASCLMLRATNFRQCPPHSRLNSSSSSSSSWKFPRLQMAARQQPDRAAWGRLAEADAAWACTRLRSCTSPALLLVRLLQLQHSPPPPSCHSYVRSQTSWQTLQNKAKKMWWMPPTPSPASPPPRT